MLLPDPYEMKANVKDQLRSIRQMVRGRSEQRQGRPAKPATSFVQPPDFDRVLNKAASIVNDVMTVVEDVVTRVRPHGPADHKAGFESLDFYFGADSAYGLDERAARFATQLHGTLKAAIALAPENGTVFETRLTGIHARIRQAWHEKQLNAPSDMTAALSAKLLRALFDTAPAEIKSGAQSRDAVATAYLIVTLIFGLTTAGKLARVVDDKSMADIALVASLRQKQILASLRDPSASLQLEKQLRTLLAHLP